MLLEKKRTKKEKCSRESAREDRDKGKVWRRKKEEKRKEKKRVEEKKRQGKNKKS